MKKNYNIRAITALIIEQVLDKGVSLSALLPKWQNQVDENDRAILQELSFGIFRYLPQFEKIIDLLTQKPLTGKLRIVHHLLTVGLYQLIYTRIPQHAAVAETVNAAIVVKRPAFKGIINAVLREFLRQKPALLTKTAAEYVNYYHPLWLLKRFQQAYPNDWLNIVNENNQKPPFWLRVNQRYITTKAYQQQLQAINIESYPDKTISQAVYLPHAVPVTHLPGFEQGLVTIQDIAAQRAALLLDPQNNEIILDLCAAPGGKTTHILELAPNANVIAVDINAERTARITENLLRLKQQARVIVGDALTPESWVDKQSYFDRILIDAPCSATGVIRRHPDIKWLRKDQDIDTLIDLQCAMLNTIWPYLRPGGTLVYTTCSILPEENQLQITRFLQQQPNALLAIDTEQTLPAAKKGDGFFYAKLVKQ